MRYLTALLAAAVVASAAPAHFVFVYFESAKEARLVFGHAAAPDPSANPARCEKTTLMARDAGGKETTLTVEKGDGNFYRAALPAGAVTVCGVTDAGVTQRGDVPAMLSWYYVKAVAGDPFAATATVGGKLLLEVVPVRDGDKVRLKVLWQGRPMADSEVTFGLPGVAEDKVPVVKTDKDGLTPAYAERGRYCVAARRLDETPGERDGKKYASVRHAATMVFDFPAAK